MLRIPHCLDNRLADGGKSVSPTFTSVARIIIFLLLALIPVKG
jgi:hypothetical protein